MNSLLLTIIIILPLIGALFIYQQEGKNKLDCSLINSFFTFSVMMIAIYLFLMTDTYSIFGFQFMEYIYISKHISFCLAINGINILFVLTVGIIFFSLSLIQAKYIKKQESVFSLISLSGIIGVFFSQNIFLLLFFLIISFLPVIYAADKDSSTKIQICASLFILCASFVYIYIVSEPVVAFEKGFNIFSLTDCRKISTTVQLYLFLPVISSLFVLSALTDWMKKTCEKSIIYSGIVSVISKIGLYIAFIFIIPIFPEGIKFYRIVISCIIVLFIIYKFIEAFCKKQLINQIINYSSIHSSFIILLIVGPMSDDLLKGIIISCLCMPFILAILLSSVGILKDREKPSEDLNGLLGAVPRLQTVFYLGLFSMMSLPGTLAFPAQFVMAFAVINLKNIFALVILLLIPIITAVYMLNTCVPLFYGKLPMSYYGIKDIDHLETAGFTIIMLLLVIMGLCPYYIDGFIANFMQTIIH